MKISRKKWMQYVTNLSKADDKAYDLISDYLYKNEISSDDGFNAFVDYMYAVVLKYSEASSELAAQAYEALALAQGATIEPAVPAPPPTYNDVAMAARGTRRRSMNPNSYAQSGSRLVKRTGVDTMLNNALRDGAQFAWIPAGDTCPFCLMLASNGWQNASKKTIKNGHAEHVHANCDCTYAVRFSDDVDVEGYNPDALREQYLNAGDNQAERINALRRAQYEQNKDFINRQKRVAYARRKMNENVANKEEDGIINTERYRIGKPQEPTEKTLQMALDKESYAYTIVEKYSINLKGSGRKIKIRIDETIPQPGKIRKNEPDVIILGRSAFVSEEELANTIAHELNHSRSYLKGGDAPEKTAYDAGDALAEYVRGER